MLLMRLLTILLAFFSLLLFAAKEYSWVNHYSREKSIERKIPVPVGFERIKVPKNSFAEWIRGLPLKEKGTRVFRGCKLKTIQEVHHAVIDIDQERLDCQQGMGSLMRLWAEYLYSQKQYKELTFVTRNDYTMNYAWWLSGFRPCVRDRSKYVMDISKREAPGTRSFRFFLYHYLRSWQGKFHEHDFRHVHSRAGIRPGDFINRGRYKDYSLLVLDIAYNPWKDKALFLLAQGSVPNQDLQVLANPYDKDLSPWYELKGQTIRTPECSFDRNRHIYRFDDVIWLGDGGAGYNNFKHHIYRFVY